MSELSHHEPSFDAIRAEAYRLYLASGLVEGRDQENWFLAKQRLYQAQRLQEQADTDGNLIHFPLNANAIPTYTPHPFPQQILNEYAS